MQLPDTYEFEGIHRYVSWVLVEYLFRDYGGDKEVVDMLLEKRRDDIYYSKYMMRLAEKHGILEDFDRYAGFYRAIWPTFDMREQNTIVIAAQHWWRTTDYASGMVTVSSAYGLRQYLGMDAPYETLYITSIRLTCQDDEREQEKEIKKLRALSGPEMHWLLTGDQRRFV